MRASFLLGQQRDAQVCCCHVTSHQDAAADSNHSLTAQVPYVPEGLEAIIFTADGDMRQALNNLQVTVTPPVLITSCQEDSLLSIATPSPHLPPHFPFDPPPPPGYGLFAWLPPLALEG